MFQDHLQKNHLTCHLCSDRFKNTYYKDYASLEIHFSKTHFLCPYEQCKAKCYVAFQTENEVKAHLDMVHRSRDTKINANSLLGFQADQEQEKQHKHKVEKQEEELQDEEGVDFGFYFSNKYQMQMVHTHPKRGEGERGGRGRGRGARGSRGRGRGERDGKEEPARGKTQTGKDSLGG